MLGGRRQSRSAVVYYSKHAPCLSMGAFPVRNHLARTSLTLDSVKRLAKFGRVLGQQPDVSSLQCRPPCSAARQEGETPRSVVCASPFHTFASEGTDLCGGAGRRRRRRSPESISLFTPPRFPSLSPIRFRCTRRRALPSCLVFRHRLARRKCAASRPVHRSATEATSLVTSTRAFFPRTMPIDQS